MLVALQTDAVRLFEAADALSIVAIRDRTQQMPNTRLPLSMIHLNPGRVGVEAARSLVDHLQGERKLSGSVAVEAAAWIEGGTIRTVTAVRASKAG